MPGLAEPISHYTDAVRAGDLLFISGVVPVDGDGRLVGGDDVVAQARQVFANVGAVLAAAGATFADVVKVNVYLTDIDDRARINPVRQEVFGEVRPASTLVEVSALAVPGAKIEIEAVALAPVTRRLQRRHHGGRAGRGAARPAARQAPARQGPDRHRRHPHDVRLEDLRGPRADAHRAGGRAARARGRRDRRQGEPARVRVGRDEPEPVVRDGAEPARTRAARPAARRAATRRRSPPGSATSASAPTPAARSACRLRAATSSA